MIKIENGEYCLIIKEGIPIAEILSLVRQEKGWKRNIKKVNLAEGISTQPYIELERNQ